MKLFKLKPAFILFSICLAVLVSVSAWRSNSTGHGKLQEYFLEDITSTPQFRFSIWKLTQGCNFGDLPFHFYQHPDRTDSCTLENPGIATYKDFVIWAGLNFPKELDLAEYKSEDQEFAEFGFIPVDSLNFSGIYANKSKQLIEKGLEYLHPRAEKGNRYYQAILAGYYFYFDDTRKGLFWAEKSAEQGETGAMKILGDAYTNGIGVVQDDIEGLKWYVIASTLGNLAAQGELLAWGHSMQNSTEKKLIWKQAHDTAKEWMNCHRSVFISN